MAWHSINQTIGAIKSDEVDTVQRFPLGLIVPCRELDLPQYGAGEMIYLPGSGVTALGRCFIIPSQLTLGVLPTPSRTAVANVANRGLPLCFGLVEGATTSQFCWYLVSGTINADVITAVADAGIYATTTAGRLSSTATAGSQVLGARVLEGQLNNVARIYINRPHSQGQIT